MRHCAPEEAQKLAGNRDTDRILPVLLNNTRPDCQVMPRGAMLSADKLHYLEANPAYLHSPTGKSPWLEEAQTQAGKL